MDDIYFDLCKECEYLYHCFSIEMAEKITSGDTNNMYLHHESCTNFYPERKQ